MSLNKKLAVVIKKYQEFPEFLGVEIVDPNQPGAVDNTLLHLAAGKGDIDDIDVLIASGAHVNVIGDIGNTPLHMAALMGQVASVRKLLQLGADSSIKNEFEQTALEVAEIGGRREIVEILKNYEHDKKNRIIRS